ncbi:MAG: insulinase family protein, partial [Candidatus Woesearchaeota archaeon]
MSLNFERLEEELRACGKYKVLQNDVTLVYEDRPGTGLVQGEITICSGSHHVHPFATMHLLEHMLFNGTLTISTPQEVDLRALQYGLLLNATTYGQQVVIPISGENETPLLQSNFIPAFSHVLDIVYHPLLTAESFLKEQIIIRREEKEDEPNPANKLLYPNNPVLWTPRSLEKVTLEQVRRLHQETFVGANTIVTLGD